MVEFVTTIISRDFVALVGCSVLNVYLILMVEFVTTIISRDFIALVEMSLTT
jgi:hypothetical protein